MGEIAVLKASLRLICFRDPAQEGLLSIFLNRQRCSTVIPGPGPVTGLLPLSYMWAGLVFPNPMLTSPYTPAPSPLPGSLLIKIKPASRALHPVNPPTEALSLLTLNNLIYSATGKNCLSGNSTLRIKAELVPILALNRAAHSQGD